MASLADHLEQAERNAKARRLVEAAQVAPEWVVTIAFYEALHWIEALCAHLQIIESHCDHRTRNHLILSEPRLGEIRRAWMKLYDASVWARYLEHHGPVPRMDARSPGLVNQATGQWLYQIRQFAQRHLPASQA